jgi:hypothetical protein
MTHKIVIPFAAAFAFALAAGNARADVPMPECVDNPACNQGGGCSVSQLSAHAPAGAGAVALAAAIAFAMRRRRRA